MLGCDNNEIATIIYQYMGKRRKDYPLIEGLEITTLAAEGKAMGKVDNQVVFVPMTVPGDVVDVQIRKHTAALWRVLWYAMS